MRVLVTGDCGLVGSTVAKHFVEKRDQVLGVDMRELGVSAGWEHLTKDISLLDKTVFAGVDVVVHCAALIDLSPKDANHLYLANVVTTEHLLQLASTAGVRCFIFISSQEVCWDGGPVQAGDP